MKSAASQTLPRSDYEIIVVKGYSDPEIDPTIDELADLSMVINEKAHGSKLAPPIKQARGNIVLILDDDDLFEPEKLKIVTDYFKSDSKLVFVHNSLSKIDEAGNPADEAMAAPNEEIMMDTTKIKRGTLSTMLKYRANWHSSCMAFRRNVLISHLDYIEKVDQSIDPFLFFTCLSSKGNLIIIPDKLTKYRVHESTANYSVSYMDFIKRKIDFYRNTIIIYEMALKMSLSTPAEKVVRASISHIRAIEAFLSPEYGRGAALLASLKLIGSFRVILTKYVAIWALLSFMKAIIGKRAAKLYYRSSIPEALKEATVNS